MSRRVTTLPPAHRMTDMEDAVPADDTGCTHELSRFGLSCDECVTAYNAKLDAERAAEDRMNAEYFNRPETPAETEAWEPRQEDKADAADYEQYDAGR